MKVKMLVGVALAGLLVTSGALAEPATFQPVDDMNTTTMQSPAGTDTAGSGSTAPATPNTMANPGASDATPAPAASPSDSAPMTPSDSGSVSNDVSADTATGDDDY